MPEIHQLIRPAVVFRSRSAQVLVVRPITLPAGRALSDWDEFKVTIREDPHWPRKWWREAKELDPYYDSWAIAFAVTLSAAAAVVADGDEEFLEFPIPAADIDVEGGFERYAFDVRGLGGAAGEVPLRDPTWATVLPRVG